MAAFIDSLMEELSKTDKSGVITTVQELKENQFGLPLQHYAQWYLFGATGLRIRVFHSISGMPASCKSPLLFDLMGHVCEDRETGGLGGIGFLYELEDKLSPTLLASIQANHGNPKSFMVIPDQTIEGAFTHIIKKLLPAYRKKCTKYDVPVMIGLDSIGGSASGDTVKKLETDGYAGKGFYDKSHFMKYFCENGGQVMGDIPVVIMCINQEKEAAAATAYGPVQKKITGGASQVFKDGHMISASYKTLASGDGKVITLRTTKTSFSDARRIEVEFRWNKYGSSDADAYGHRFNWALASARCIADPDKGVGEIRDICDVSVSDKELVTCPQLGLRSVPAEEFEAALMADAKVLNALCTYQKIERIKGMEEYAEYLARKKSGAKAADTVEEPEATVRVSRKPAKKPKKTEPTPIMDAMGSSEEDGDEPA